MDIAKRLTDAFTGGSWDGDIDNAPETISPGLRSRITTPAWAAPGAYSAQCAVLRSRNTVRDAQIVVTNHALLLSALSIGDSDNGQPLIAPPSDMLLVLDEGHHIGNVAIDQGAASLALDEMAKRTGRLQILIAGAYRAVDKDRLGNLLPNEAIEVASNVAKQLRAFRDHIERVWMPAPADEEPTAFAGGLARADRGTGRRDPQPLQLGACRYRAGGQGQAGRRRARAPAAQPGHGAGNDRATVQPVAGLAPRGQGRRAADGALGHRHPRRRPGAARLAGIGAHVLRKLLWDEVDSVVMTSATLTGGGDFQSLAIDNGIPEEAEMVSLSSPFDLPNQAELIVPRFPVTPTTAKAIPAKWRATSTPSWIGPRARWCCSPRAGRWKRWPG